MLVRKQLLLVIAIFNSPVLFSMQVNLEQAKKIVSDIFVARTADVQEMCKNMNNAIFRVNEVMCFVHSVHETAIKTYEKSNESTVLLEKLQEITGELQSKISILKEQVKSVKSNLNHEYDVLVELLASEVAKQKGIMLDLAKQEKEINLNDKVQIEKIILTEKKRLGIFEQEAKAMAQASIDVEKEKWKNIGDLKLIIKFSLAIIVTAFCIYTAKYGMPVFMNYLTKPRVISETSRGWFGPKANIRIEDLIFMPSLQDQLSDLLLRVQFAQKHNEALPNVLFYGVSGTGKTAFAKALAYASGFDYALTSGSEFLKITDQKTANDELRKFLNWAKKSKNGLIVFIDEAESLFSNRMFKTTPRATQDLINTFLSLISDQSQKKLMFIFATNIPFKLDPAIINRIGISVEFILPGAAERERILFMYLFEFAKEDKKSIVQLHPTVKQMLPIYAERLEGFSPRAIKFIAQEIIIKARRLESKNLTNDIVCMVIDDAKKSLKHADLWKDGYEQL